MTQQQQYKWQACIRQYGTELTSGPVPVPLTAQDSHPLDLYRITPDALLPTTTSNSTVTGPLSTSNTAIVDPLSVSSSFSAIHDPLSSSMASDPLISALTESSTKTTKDRHQGEVFRGNMSTNNDTGSSSDIFREFEPWSSKRTNILMKYTTSEKLSITTSFLTEEEKERIEVKAKVATGTDKTKHRLEQLDDFEEGSVKQMLNLSQQEYVKKIDEMQQALVKAWDLEQRVKCLKIAIQAAKLLGDVSVIQFYPSKFVLITDILETFGTLVFDRIYKKCLIDSGIKVHVTPQQFDFSMVTESARETCRNWFYKIASIRELIPRYYSEVAILKCYSFLTKSEYSQALMRLANTTRGIGNPLVSLYARCYLCRVGMDINPELKAHTFPLCEDVLKSLSQIDNQSVSRILTKQKIDSSAFISLFLPGLEWILQCLAHKFHEGIFEELLQKINETSNVSIVLNAVMSAFPPQFISTRCLQFVDMIKDTTELGVPRTLLYKTLGLSVALYYPPEDSRKPLLTAIWKQVSKFDNINAYIECAEVWSEFTARHFKRSVINNLLGDMIRNLSDNRAFENFYTQLASIVTKIISNINDFSTLFSMDKFLPFLDMFQKESVRFEVCRNIVETFIKYHTDPTQDPIILNAMLYICKILHDSLNALTPQDEKRQIAMMIKQFISRVDFGRDFEQQLSFYVEARASFTNMDLVLVRLILSVNTLSTRTLRRVKGKHTNKTAGFVRACTAYCFITIPSLNSNTARLDLYLLSAQVAYQNGCVSQGDVLLEAAISLIEEVPQKIERDNKLVLSDSYLLEYCSGLLSTLLYVPDNPSKPCLYLLRQLLDVILKYDWPEGSIVKQQILCHSLSLLNAYAQSNYIYMLPRVESNLTLYGGDRKFIAELSAIATVLITELMGYLKADTNTTTTSINNKYRVALLLFNYIITHTDVGSDMCLFAEEVWILVSTLKVSEDRFCVNTEQYVKNNPDYITLANKII